MIKAVLKPESRFGVFTKYQDININSEDERTV